MTGVFGHNTDGSVTWIPQEKISIGVRRDLEGAYRESYKAKWGVDVDVTWTTGPQPDIPANLTVYDFGHRLDGGGRLVPDGNEAAEPPESSERTGAVPAVTSRPIRGVPLSQHLQGSAP